MKHAIVLLVGLMIVINSAVAGGMYKKKDYNGMGMSIGFVIVFTILLCSYTVDY